MNSRIYQVIICSGTGNNVCFHIFPSMEPPSECVIDKNISEWLLDIIECKCCNHLTLVACRAGKYMSSSLYEQCYDCYSHIVHWLHSGTLNIIHSPLTSPTPRSNNDNDHGIHGNIEASDGKLQNRNACCSVISDCLSTRAQERQVTEKCC